MRGRGGSVALGELSARWLRRCGEERRGEERSREDDRNSGWTEARGRVEFTTLPEVEQGTDSRRRR